MTQRNLPMLRLAGSILLAALPLNALAGPCTVEEFNSCYIGVDAVDPADTQVLATAAGPYDFVGIGIRGKEPNLSGSDPDFVGAASGTLQVLSGGVLTLNYLPLTIGEPGFRPDNNSVFVGVSDTAVGVLEVDGGTVTTPLLFVGQADDTRPSTGIVTIANGGTVTATIDSLAGPLINLNAVNVGRGLGSTGTLAVSGAGSALSTPDGGISLGRLGTATLSLLDGGVVTIGGTLFGSTVSPLGRADILVQGEGSTLDVGTFAVLVGINVVTLALDDPNHGTATLDVRDGGQVLGDVTVGPGGTLRGDGTIVGDVLNRGGVIDPGNSPGTLHIDGSLTQQGGVFDIEIAGPSLFDVIDVSGDVTLEDVLIRFTFLDGYAPGAGDAFEFLRVARGSLLANVDPVFAVRGLQPAFEFSVSNLDGVLRLDALSDGIAVPAPDVADLLLLAGIPLLPLLRRRAARRA